MPGEVNWPLLHCCHVADSPPPTPHTHNHSSLFSQALFNRPSSPLKPYNQLFGMQWWGRGAKSPYLWNSGRSAETSIGHLHCNFTDLHQLCPTRATGRQRQRKRQQVQPSSTICSMLSPLVRSELSTLRRKEHLSCDGGWVCMEKPGAYGCRREEQEQMDISPLQTPPQARIWFASLYESL